MNLRKGLPAVDLSGFISHPLKIVAPALLLMIPILPHIPVTRAAGPRDENLNIEIQVNVSWKDYDSHSAGILQTGSFSVQVSGTATQLPTGNQNQGVKTFLPGQMNATYHYENKGYSKNPGGKCPALQFDVSGSGSVQVLSAMGMTAIPADPSSIVFFHLVTGTGDAFKMGYRAFFQDYVLSPEDFQRITSGPARDMYVFSFAPLTMKYKGRRQWNCAEYRDTDGHQSFILGGVFGLPAQGMIASYHWQCEPVSCGASALGEDMRFLDWGEIKKYPQDTGSGSHRYQASWRFGKIRPIVKIKRLKKVGNAEVWDDITDRPDTKPSSILIGKKVRLKAEVEPSSEDAQNGQWEISGDVVSGYEADDDHGKVLPLGDEQKRSPRIEFAWVDGQAAGAPYKATYHAVAKSGDKADGSATFRVYEPQVAVTKETGNVTVGPWPPHSCRLYLGSLSSVGPNPAGQPGMYLESNITLPTEFMGEPYRAAYVQLIKEDALARRSSGGSYRQNGPSYYWEREANPELCLDTSYPYHYKFFGNMDEKELDDTPGVELDDSTWEARTHDSFETYLMFLPSENPYSDPDAVWVPLKKVTWNWGAGVLRGEKDAYACDPRVFKIINQQKPTPKVEDCHKHPEWTCNVKSDHWVSVPDGK